VAQRPTIEQQVINTDKRCAVTNSLQKLLLFAPVYAILTPSMCNLLPRKTAWICQVFRGDAVSLDGFAIFGVGGNAG